jgi:hypothetical protein
MLYAPFPGYFPTQPVYKVGLGVIGVLIGLDGALPSSLTQHGFVLLLTVVKQHFVQGKL